MLQKKRVASLSMEPPKLVIPFGHANACAKVLLRLQPPDLNLQTLDLGNSRVLCAAASPDNTLLAVGCERGDGTAGHAQSPHYKDPLGSVSPAKKGATFVRLL